MNNLAFRLQDRNDLPTSSPLMSHTGPTRPGLSPILGPANRRFFAQQPIFNHSKRIVAYEALFRAGWDDQFGGDSDTATRIMIDNWLLFGFNDLNGGYTTSINCTRETLTSHLLTLLPRSAILEILESVEPDEELVRACRVLKALGYKIALDDFVDPEKMEPFLDFADFVKIDFRQSDSRHRAKLVRRLRPSGATLIAEKIETEEEFLLAEWEGFHLFQGHYFPQRASFAIPRDDCNGPNSQCILDILDRPGFPINKLADLIHPEPGIACRLLRKANWLAGSENPVNAIRDALKLVGKSEFRKLVVLALYVESSNWNELGSELTRFDDPAIILRDYRHKADPRPSRRARRSTPRVQASGAHLQLVKSRKPGTQDPPKR